MKKPNLSEIDTEALIEELTNRFDALVIAGDKYVTGPTGETGTVDVGRYVGNVRDIMWHLSAMQQIVFAQEQQRLRQAAMQQALKAAGDEPEKGPDIIQP